MFLFFLVSFLFIITRRENTVSSQTRSFLYNYSFSFFLSLVTTSSFFFQEHDLFLFFKVFFLLSLKILISQRNKNAKHGKVIKKKQRKKSLAEICFFSFWRKCFFKCGALPWSAHRKARYNVFLNFAEFFFPTFIFLSNRTKISIRKLTAYGFYNFQFFSRFNFVVTQNLSGFKPYRTNEQTEIRLGRRRKKNHRIRRARGFRTRL